MNDIVTTFTSIPNFWLIVAGVAVLVVLARRIRILGMLMTIGLIAVSIALFTQRASFDPGLDTVAKAFNLGDQGQQVVGKEMRVPMARDGHFWVRVKVADIEQRMLVDSGATVTALSSDAARAMRLKIKTPLFPVVLQTANGSINAQTAVIAELRIGNVVARDLPVVVSPAFGEMSVVGMNFLSRLKSWRVEGKTLILEPHHPQATT
ncbi:retropepsin-like aspartic protease family protein [Sphingomonas endolithica]|uniref:retropepsin-like aspartic protease family protein n=1 Tax=Sphingomonas endolithica TaxID=2972485 RepID=UPI0021AFD1D2|nr:TIGR02281 family clan AA aspartic protease [Sphingomonas sp. ZFBP2030]